jgi:hypothetical protein
MNELLLLSASSSEYEALADARSLLTRLGITYRDKSLPQPPSLSLLQSFLQELAHYPVALWACGESAYLLPLISLNAPQTLLIVMPVPSACPSRKPTPYPLPGSRSSSPYCSYSTPCRRKRRPPRRKLAQRPPFQLPRHPPSLPPPKTPPPKCLNPSPLLGFFLSS